MFVCKDRFDSFHLGVNRQPHTRREGFVSNILHWLLHQCFDGPNNAKKVLVVLIHPNTIFLGVYTLHYFHQGLNRKLKICTGVVYRKTITSIMWVGILTVRRFQKTPKFYWFISIFILRFSSSHRSDFSPQSLNQKLYFCSRFAQKKSYPALILVSRCLKKVPKSANIMKSSRLSNSLFSIQLNLLLSGKVPFESLLYAETFFIANFSTSFFFLKS